MVTVGRLRLVSLALMLGAPVGLPSQLGAQAVPERLGTGVGWAFVLPDAFLGAGAFHVFGGTPWGVYADVKRTHTSLKDDRNYWDGQTVASVQAELQPERRDPVISHDEWLVWNAGIVRLLTPEFGVSLGGGMARKRVIQEYLDYTTDAVTSSGFYFVEDEEATKWTAMASVLAIIRAGDRVALAFGADSATAAASLGVFLLFR